MKKTLILSTLILGIALVGCSKNNSTDTAASTAPASTDASAPTGAVSGKKPIAAHNADGLGIAGGNSGLGTK